MPVYGTGNKFPQAPFGLSMTAIIVMETTGCCAVASTCGRRPRPACPTDQKTAMTALSILDLVRIPEGSSAGTAIDNARILAAAAEGWGYHRYWVAEHHSMPGLASSATSLVLAHIASGSKTIRVGAGGVMLPNHSPLIIAEQFGTLAELYPDRIDLGVGRSDGSVDGPTSAALRRQSSALRFPQDVAELQHYFSKDTDLDAVKAVPASNKEVPLWILGTSTFGARLAADLGLPFAFGSHLIPDQLGIALRAYRDIFRPSKQLTRPYAMVSVNVLAAETDEEAEYLSSTRKMSFTDLIRGPLGPSRPPIENMDTYWSPTEKAHVTRMLAKTVVGSVDTVRAGLDAILKETAADEIIAVTDVHDFSKRLRSAELVAQAFEGL